ncbi:class I SAM-dependent methyltransferase [Zavarzinia sp. CC-PAN008]|uniref:class I SAM-dependent methyltransferase n=1 Tax=Zavarzinia sp. CC-PAN008 TaxID=3243332 RepID=UPI003F7489F3
MVLPPTHEANRRHWDEITPIHVASRFYDVDAFLAGRDSLGPIEHAGMGPVGGLSILHLQCHFGLDTLSWARAGAARVLGVDISAVAVAEAQSLARRAGLFDRADFVIADVTRLNLGTRFDRVFASHGALIWLSDLEAWAGTVARHLKPGGFLYLLEGHPVGTLLELSAQGGLVLPFDYFHAEPIADRAADYAEPSYTPSHAAQIHLWTTAELVQALLKAGLTIVGFEEYPQCAWPAWSDMVATADGYYFERPPGQPTMPMMLGIKAVQPG